MLVVLGHIAVLTIIAIRGCSVKVSHKVIVNLIHVHVPGYIGSECRQLHVYIYYRGCKEPGIWHSYMHMISLLATSGLSKLHG